MFFIVLFLLDLFYLFFCVFIFYKNKIIFALTFFKFSPNSSVA
ncbi:hypothetical protein A4U88_4787 [Serratia marcescens]|nr:hypothetical protein A4U88_4787 [Serratia marcescens]